VEIRELAVPHSFEITPVLHPDSRGVFLEAYRFDLLAHATGRRFDIRQANTSISRRGVGRGIHYAEVHGENDGQAKYVTAAVGTVLDFVVDIRIGSPSFGAWDVVELNDTRHNAVFMAEGLGHLFVATSETAKVNYLTNGLYRPSREHGISVFDPAIGLDFSFPRAELVLSAADIAAPSLAEAERAGTLPTWDDCLALYASLSIGVAS
jgi:dTDP-4-dehydrorhamnose 3,5-epimerase